MKEIEDELSRSQVLAEVRKADNRWDLIYVHCLFSVWEFVLVATRALEQVSAEVMRVTVPLASARVHVGTVC